MKDVLETRYYLAGSTQVAVCRLSPTSSERLAVQLRSAGYSEFGTVQVDGERPVHLIWTRRDGKISIVKAQTTDSPTEEQRTLAVGAVETLWAELEKAK